VLLSVCIDVIMESLVDAAETEQFRRAVEQCALSYCETIRRHVLKQTFQVTIYGVEGDTHKLEAVGSQDAIQDNVVWKTECEGVTCDADDKISLLLRIPAHQNVKQVGFSLI